MATKPRDESMPPQAVIEPKDEEKVIWEYGAIDKETRRFLTAGHGERGKKAALDFCGSKENYEPAKRLVHTAESLKETD